jgi:hypothetical protein
MPDSDWWAKVAAERDIHRLPESRCLECGSKLNASATREGLSPRPNPGDVTVCLKCGAAMVFGDDLRLRGFTDAEAAELVEDPETMNELARITRAVHILRHARG